MMEQAALLVGAAHVAQRVTGGAFSATGSWRKDNEDAFGLPQAGGLQSRYGTLVAVADGVGSRPGGSAASRADVHFLQAHYHAPIGPRDPGTRLRHCFQIVNTLNRVTLKTNGQKNQGEPLTTLVAAVAYNERLWVANVGDSRAYHAHGGDGQLQRLTEDHSQVVMAAPAAGAAGAPPAAWAPSATQPLAPTAVLTRAIGLEDQCQVDVCASNWEAGDRLILASDGLRGLPDANLAQLALARSPTEPARALVTEALRRDDSDNATAVVAAWESAARRLSRPGRASTRAPARSEPAWRELSLVTVVAGVLGLLMGWASAVAVFLYFGAMGWFR